MAIGRTFDARIKYEQFNLIMSFFNEFPVCSFFSLHSLVCYSVDHEQWATILLSLTYFWIKFGHLLSLVLIYLRFPSIFFCFAPKNANQNGFRYFILVNWNQSYRPFYECSHSLNVQPHTRCSSKQYISILCGAIKMEIHQLKRTKF